MIININFLHYQYSFDIRVDGGCWGGTVVYTSELIYTAETSRLTGMLRLQVVPKMGTQFTKANTHTRTKLFSLILSFKKCQHINVGHVVRCSILFPLVQNTGGSLSLLIVKMWGLCLSNSRTVCVCARALSLLSAACLTMPEVLPQGVLPPVIFTQGKGKKPLNEVHLLSSQK